MSTKLRPQRKIVVRNSGNVILKKGGGGGVKKQQSKRTGRKGHIPDAESTDALLTVHKDEEKQPAQEGTTDGETTTPTVASAVATATPPATFGGSVFRFVSFLFQPVSLPISIDGPLGLGLLPMSAAARMNRIKQIAKDQKRSDQNTL